jgi:hypothetical protein
MYALAHTSAKPCYLSLGKSVIYLKPIIDSQAYYWHKNQEVSVPTMQKAR